MLFYTKSLKSRRLAHDAATRCTSKRRREEAAGKLGFLNQTLTAQTTSDNRFSVIRGQIGTCPRGRAVLYANALPEACCGTGIPARFLLASSKAAYITAQALIADGGNIIQENKGA